MSRLVQQMSDGNGNNTRKNDVRRDNSHSGGTRRVRNQYRELGSRCRAKEMIIPEGKTTMTNVDYVGRRASGQKTAVTVLLVEVLPTLNETPRGIKERKKRT